VKALLGLVFALAVLAGCAAQPREENFAGLVDIGDGRRLFLNCQGTGSPTIFIVPGKGSYAEAWNVVVPTDDPVRLSPYDIIGQANLQPSPTATQPRSRRRPASAPTTGPTPARTGRTGPPPSRNHTRCRTMSMT
jgi:hypothetical protein